MEQSWWYRKDQEQRGPFNASQMQALVREGVVGPDTPVSEAAPDDAEPVWVPLRHIAAIDSVAPPANPPPPETPAPANLGPPPPSPTAADGPSWATAVLAHPAGSSAPAPADAQNTEAGGLLLAGPWRRFFARTVDASVFGYAAGLLLGLLANAAFPAFAMWLQSPNARLFVPVAALPLALGMEAIVAGLFGTTIGKVLLGVRVTTLSGARPSFGQFAGRLAGLYWSALALGVLFVNLITMGRQYWLVKKGRPTGYDEGRFLVSAQPLGKMRVAGAVAVVLMAVAINQDMLFEQRMSKRDYDAGFAWRNPVSGITAPIPPGWLHAKRENDTGDPIYTFSSDKLGVVAIFAMEEEMGHLSLEEYKRVWSSVVSSDMLIDERSETVRVNGRETLQAHGTMANNATRRVHATLLKSGDQVWRLILVGLPGREPDGILARHLRETLVSTVREQPDSSSPARRSPTGQTI